MATLYHTAITFIGNRPYLFILRKRCSDCERFLPFDDFQQASSQRDGIAGRCKECMKPVRKANEATRKDRIAEQRHARWVTDEYHEKRNAYQKRKYAEKKAAKARELLLNPPLPKLNKICPTCEPPTEKPLEDFPLAKNHKDGRGTYCKACVRAYGRSEEAKARKNARTREKLLDPEYRQAVRKANNEYRRLNPLQQQEFTMRRNARKKAATTSRVSYKRILATYGYHCYICDKPIDKDAPKRSRESLTFDHVIPIQPRLGEPQGEHCTENLRPAHKVCNARKNNKPLSALTDWERQGP